MKALFRLSVIIGAPPNTLTNGTTADATQVMADLNWIVNQVNANAAPLATTALTNANNNFSVVQSGIAASAAANFPIASQVQNWSFNTLTSTLGTNSLTSRIAQLPLAAYGSGQVFSLIPAQTNTGSANITIDSAGSSILFSMGSAVIGQEARSGIPLLLFNDGVKSHILNSTNGDYRITKAFTVAGTFQYTMPAGMKRARITVVGSGAAGGGAAATAGGQGSAGAGGGAGATYIGTFTAAQIGSAAVTITVGAGGTGVAGTTGNNGNSSSFGSLVTSTGGTGAATSAASGNPAAAAPGAGGTASGSASLGEIKVTGGSGYLASQQVTVFGYGGKGADTPYGFGGSVASISSNGNNATGSGSGGGGGVNDQNQVTARTGGNGADGAVFIEEFF